MQFTPKTESVLEQEEQERMASQLWPNGDYPFEVLEKCPFERTEDRQSKNGNDMIVLALKFWNEEGESIYVADYLTEKMAFKLRHFSYTTGLGKQYEAGALSAVDTIGKTGVAKLKTQPPQNGYSAKNVVQDYIVPPEGQIAATAAATAKAQAGAPELDDLIPF